MFMFGKRTKLLVSLLLCMMLVMGINPMLALAEGSDTDVASALIGQSDTYSSADFGGDKYWVVFHEGFRDGRLEASSFNVTSGNPHLYWEMSLTICDATLDGEVNQYYYDSGSGKWVRIGSYDIPTDWAIDIVASNMEVHGPNGEICYVPARPQNADSVPIYRMYNSVTSEHLYTTSKAEFDSCGKGAYKDWKAEGVAWNAPAKGTAGASPVWRLYNEGLGDHHYTASAGERDALVSKAGWKVEGVAFYTAAKGNGTVGLYRLYNGGLMKGQHHYTASAGERDALVANAGWKAEGVAFYGLK